MEDVRTFLDLAKAEFAFLNELGFELAEEKGPTSTSYRDGFHLRYIRNPVELVVQYYDVELVPTFRLGSTRVSYWFADRYLFGNASGYAGAMFPLDKLAAAIRIVAREIRDHYSLVLSGDDATWKKLTALLSAPQVKQGVP